MLDVRTHIYFYEMLVDDFDDFMKEQHSARRAFHCILEAYHLREWVWHDWLENDDAARKRSALRERPSSMRSSTVPASGFHISGP